MLAKTKIETCDDFSPTQNCKKTVLESRSDALYKIPDIRYYFLHVSSTMYHLSVIHGKMIGKFRKSSIYQQLEYWNAGDLIKKKYKTKKYSVWSF